MFAMTTSKSEPATKLINRSNVKVKNTKRQLEWLGKHESMFLIVSLCAKQIFLNSWISN
jgi:hypothetical protein